MYKSILFLACIFLYGRLTLAQKPVFNYETIKPAGKIKGNFHESFFLTDNVNHTTTLILKSKETIDYLLLNKDFSVLSKVTPPEGLSKTIFKAGWYKYLGAVANKKGSCFIYSVKDKEWNNGNYQIRMETVDFKTKTVTNAGLFEIPDNETTIEWFTNQQTFWLITSRDKTKELVFYIIDENGNLDKKVAPIDLTGYNRQKLSISEYFSYSHVFQPAEESELIAGTDLTKIYVYPEQVIIIVVNDKEPPHVWTIDTRSFKISQQKFNLEGFAGFNGNKEKSYYSTHLFNDNLYVLTTSKSKIEIGVFNFSTGKLLKKHEITETSAFDYPENPVEITSKGRATRKNEITSNKELIKEIAKGSTGIAIARNNKGQLILTCGVYDKEMRTTGGHSTGGFVPATMPAGGTHAGSNVPITRSYSNFNSMSNYKPGHNYNYVRTLHFRTILDASDFSMVKSNEKESNLDKINKHLWSLPPKTEAENIFSLAGNYYLGYYNPDTNNFTILEFKTSN